MYILDCIFNSQDSKSQVPGDATRPGEVAGIQVPKSVVPVVPGSTTKKIWENMEGSMVLPQKWMVYNRKSDFKYFKWMMK